MSSRFLAASAIAAAYTLGGWLALQLAVPPGYAAPLFPPAGIALSALLIFGNRMWPAVLAGSLGVQVLATLQSNGDGLYWAPLLVAVGATLQALTGAWLARRLIGFPDPLDTPLPVVKFLVGVAPLSSLVSASVAIPCLMLNGMLAPADAAFNWWNWWLGDTLGVILAAPLMFVFFGQPRSDWRPRRLVVAVPLAAAFALLGVAYQQVRYWDELRIRSQFDRDAENVASLVRKRLDVQLDMMLSVERLMSISDEVTADDFRAFVLPWLQRYPGSQNIAWAPSVSAAERNAFEARIAATVHPGFRILDRDKDGTTFPAAPAAEYLPIVLVEPQDANRDVVGLNPLSLEASAGAIMDSRRTGRATATAAIHLVQDRGEQRGVVVYLPVRKDDGSVSSAPGGVRGQISAVFRMDDALNATLAPRERANIDLCMVDVDERLGATRLSGPAGCESAAWLEHPVTRAIPVAFAGRHWELRLRATPGYLAALRSWAAWTTIAVGLCAIGILGAFLLVTTGHTRRIAASAREAEATADYLAHFDALTGLPNRAAWMKHARTALHAAERHGDIVAVLFLDLDQFKTVNDSLGHPVGDRLLASVAARLAPCLRDEDYFARLGGDEFVALLPRLTHAEEAAAVARRMLAVLAQPLAIDGHELSPTVSIGIALYPGDARDVDALLKHADAALYSAKEAGRNNYQFFVPEMNARAVQRLTLESALRRAIERDELDLHYQAQLDADSGKVVGCEALVRWQHPTLGMVMPNHFIPVAENSGLIVPLGMWVLREACRQQVLWARNGAGEMVVAVNISALQFRKSDFAEQVQGVLQETGADPRRIELEITESALMEPSDELLARLDRLVGMGLKLALDDFGTGYSSLAYLKRLPISRLKLDRSFVKDLPGDPEDAAVASATLSLARDLGLEVVAEGVETLTQRDYLRQRGCTVMQGFLFARPLPVVAFDNWLIERATA